MKRSLPWLLLLSFGGCGSAAGKLRTELPFLPYVAPEFDADDAEGESDATQDGAATPDAATPSPTPGQGKR